MQPTDVCLRTSIALRVTLDLHTKQLRQSAASEEHLVMVTILLERALSASVTVLTSISWQVLLLSCFFLASKDLDDDPVSFRDLRMLAVMHDVRSAATGGLTPQKGASLSSCYNEDIEDIEI